MTTSPRIGLAALAGAGLGLAGAGLGLAGAAMALAFARQVVTPARHRPDDVEVLAVEQGRVVLRSDATTTAPGRYGVTAGSGRTHARLGQVVATDTTAGTVTRELVAVDAGVLRPGPARWSGWYFAGDPSAVGLAFRDVALRSDVGVLPAWLVTTGEETRGTWAVLVHGRGATREECLRALPVLHRLGIPALVTSYRNDDLAPASPAGRYGLGDTEWVDVEAAVLHALAAGAQDVVVLAWSMGAALSLSFLSRSWTADRVRALVLDSPVLDWRDVLDHHARLHRVPRPLARSGLAALASPLARATVGVDGPVDLRRMDWVARADELTVPTLVLHSEDDEFVPIGPSRSLATARPDLVRLVPFTGAGHCRGWNLDPDRWDREVARFLLELL